MNKNKGKTPPIISIFCIAIAILLCALLFHSPIFHPGSIYDDGDLLVKESERYQCWKSNGVTLNQNPTVFSIRRFSGIRTIHILEIAENDPLGYSWNVSVESGKFKIVLIDNSNSTVVETICEGSANGSANNHDLPAGEYRVKFVGDNAFVEGEFNIHQ